MASENTAFAWQIFRIYRVQYRRDHTGKCEPLQWLQSGNRRVESKAYGYTGAKRNSLFPCLMWQIHIEGNAILPQWGAEAGCSEEVAHLRQKTEGTANSDYSRILCMFHTIMCNEVRFGCPLWAQSVSSSIEQHSWISTEDSGLFRVNHLRKSSREQLEPKLIALTLREFPSRLKFNGFFSLILTKSSTTKSPFFHNTNFQPNSCEYFCCHPVTLHSIRITWRRRVG